MNDRITRRRWARGCGVATVIALTLAATFAVQPGSARAADAKPAQSGTSTMKSSVQPLPNSVLLFPPTPQAADSGAAANAAPASASDNDQIVTEAMREALAHGGIGVVIYDRRLPSIQRAVSEGVRPEDAAKGPGDDPRKAQRFADILGASEYLTVSIDDYKYDAKSRTATFSLSVFRNAASGAPLGTSALNATGTAAADVPASLQEGAAVARAAKSVAEQTVQALYPQSAALFAPPKPKAHHKTDLKKLLLVPVLAIGAALIAPKQ